MTDIGIIRIEGLAFGFEAAAMAIAAAREKAQAFALVA